MHAICCESRRVTRCRRSSTSVSTFDLQRLNGPCFSDSCALYRCEQDCTKMLMWARVNREKQHAKLSS